MRYLQKVDLPEASITPFAIQRFTVSEDAAKMGALRGMFSGGRYTKPERSSVRPWPGCARVASSRSRHSARKPLSAGSCWRS
jgi:hypothetical protein